MTAVLRLAVLARRSKVPAGISRIIGLTGRVETAIAPEGTIFLRNELWRARSLVAIPPGEIVRVTGITGLVLDVAPEQDNQRRVAQGSRSEDDVCKPPGTPEKKRNKRKTRGGEP